MKNKEIENKIITFWNKYDGKEFTREDLREYFTIDELVTIVNEENLLIFILFKNKLEYINNLFTFEELNNIKDKSNKLSMLKFYTDEELLSLIKDNSDYLLTSNAIENLSDNLKIKYIDYCDIETKKNIIKSIKSDKLKLDLLRKYFNEFSNGKLSELLLSFNDKELCLDLMPVCNDIVKKYIIWGLSFDKNNVKLIRKILSNIKDEEEVCDTLFNLLSYYEEFKDEIDQTFDKVDKDKKVTMLLEYYSKTKDFTFLEKVKDKNLIFEFINNLRAFPPYEDRYEYIIDLYVDKYKVDKNKLLLMVKNISFFILNVLDNENIKKY